MGILIELRGELCYVNVKQVASVEGHKTKLASNFNEAMRKLAGSGLKIYTIRDPQKKPAAEELLLYDKGVEINELQIKSILFSKAENAGEFPDNILVISAAKLNEHQILAIAPLMLKHKNADVFDLCNKLTCIVFLRDNDCCGYNVFSSDNLCITLHTLCEWWSNSVK